jgi:hypothetical protein
MAVLGKSALHGADFAGSRVRLVAQRNRDLAIKLSTEHK